MRITKMIILKMLVMIMMFMMTTVTVMMNDKKVWKEYLHAMEIFKVTGDDGDR